MSCLALGGHTFLSSFGGTNRAAEIELLKILNASLDAGIHFLDVTYDEERETLGMVTASSGRRNEAFVSSWAQAKHTPTGAATIQESERALKQLRIERLDHFYIEVDCSDDHARALDQLKSDGTIRAAGMLGADRALAAGPEKFDACVSVYNFYRQGAFESFDALHEKGIGTICAEPLGRGRFLQKHPSQATQMVGALLRFVFAHTGIDGTLLTMRSMDELKANVEMARGPKELTEEDREMLEKGKGYEIEFDPWK